MHCCQARGAMWFDTSLFTRHGQNGHHHSIMGYYIPPCDIICWHNLLSFLIALCQVACRHTLFIQLCVDVGMISWDCYIKPYNCYLYAWTFQAVINPCVGSFVGMISLGCYTILLTVISRHDLLRLLCTSVWRHLKAWTLGVAIWPYVMSFVGMILGGCYIALSDVIIRFYLVGRSCKHMWLYLYARSHVAVIYDCILFFRKHGHFRLLHKSVWCNLNPWSLGADIQSCVT